MMMIPFLSNAFQTVASPPPALIVSTTRHAAANLAIHLRGGGAAAAAFDMGLAKTRLEGLAYGTVTALMTQAALHLFKAVDGDNRKVMPLPQDDDKRRHAVLFQNILKITFGVLVASTVALGIYTTTIFTVMSIYSKTALGMGLESRFSDFFNACEKFRHYGFMSFVATLATFSMGWVCSLLLTYEDDTRWWIALPAILVGIMGFLHYKEIFGLATTLIYSS